MTDLSSNDGASGHDQPAANETKGTPLSAGGRRPDGSVCRILVIEDDAPVRETCVRLLQQEGYDVAAAADGEGGWSAMQERRFDVVVSDNRMPRLTGVEMIRRMRTAGCGLPVILASGTMPWDSDDIPAELRPLLLLPKPYGRDSLLGALHEVLEEEFTPNVPAGQNFANPPPVFAAPSVLITASVAAAGPRPDAAALSHWETEGGKGGGT